MNGERKHQLAMALTPRLVLPCLLGSSLNKHEWSVSNVLFHHLQSYPHSITKKHEGPSLQQWSVQAKPWCWKWEKRQGEPCKTGGAHGVKIIYTVCLHQGGSTKIYYLILVFEICLKTQSSGCFSGSFCVWWMHLPALSRTRAEHKTLSHPMWWDHMSSDPFYEGDALKCHHYSLLFKEEEGEARKGSFTPQRESLRWTFWLPEYIVQNIQWVEKIPCNYDIKTN